MSQDWKIRWHSFPLVPGTKVPPKGCTWKTAADTSPKVGNHAIKCGKDSDLFVTDIDAAGAREHLEATAGCTLPATHRVNTSIDPETGFQKYQLYYRHPKALTPLGCEQGLFGGIDIRAEGGYVVAAGAQHIPVIGSDGKPVAGHDGKPIMHQYATVDDREPVDLPSTILHALELAKQQKKNKNQAGTDGATKITTARNPHLASFAGTLRRQGWNPDQIFEALRVENHRICSPPKPDSELRRIANSIGSKLPGEKPTRTLFLKIKKATELDSAPQLWLWYQVIRLGVLNLFVGLPDIGKTFICILIIAHLTRGKKFPFSKVPVERARVLVICKEDDEAMWKSRLRAADADLEMVDFVTDVGVTENGSSEPWRLDSEEHRNILKTQLLQNPDYKLCLVDPISSFVPHSNMNDQANVRQVLDPFTKIAQETSVAMLLNAHTTKALIDSVLKAASGSIQIMASVQNAFYFADDPQKEGQRLMLQARNKSGVGNTGFRFRIESRYPDWYVRNEYDPDKDPGIGVAVIEAQSEVSANELLRRALEKDAPKVAKCAEFLSEFLARGSVHRDKCLDAIRTLGFSDSVRDDACARLKIRRPRKPPFMWSLPTENDKQKSAAELVAEDMALISETQKKDLTEFDFGANEPGEDGGRSE